MQSATQLLDELDIDRSNPIDPFLAMDVLGLEVRFDDWKGLFGAILPLNPPHVLINKKIPGAVQRFTAAHEIGHFVLHADDPAVDLHSHIDGIHSVGREQEAQAFAASFLMPLDLLYHVADRYSVEEGRDISPDQVYAMARDMHVSYAAAVHQLANTRIIRASARGPLLKAKPLALKKRITHGTDIANARGDVWLLDGSGSDLVVEVFAGDEIVVTLPENPTTGYTWKPDLSNWTVEELDRRTVESLIVQTGSDMRIVQDDFEPASEARGNVGEGGIRRVGMWASNAGNYKVRMRNARPFAPADAPVEQGLLAHVRRGPQDEMKARYISDFHEHERHVNYLDRIDTE